MKSIPQKIVGRKREQKLLKDLLDSQKAEFIAVYGRRRIGKTYLVRNLVAGTSSIFLHVTGLQGGSLQKQLSEFARQIGITFYGGAAIVPRQSWLDAFEDLTQAMNKLPADKTITLFLDELPWMATHKSKMLTAIELYWNRHWVFNTRIKLIICGSATSWIIEKIINNRGGLHNRVTRTIHLKPFSLFECGDFLREQGIELDQRQTLALYTAFGGVPLYWSYIRKGLSAHQIIDELCFQSDGPLVHEFIRLFQSLFNDPQPYELIIRTVAKYRYGISQAQLIKESGLADGGGTVRKFQELEETGFIMSLVPYGRKERGIYYVIDDEYSLFYLRWIEPNLKSIAKKSKGKGFWLTQSSQPAWKSWRGIAFESICYKHIDQLRIALGINQGAIPGTWRTFSKNLDPGAQVDLLFDRQDDAITLCEIKCSEEPFAIDKTYSQNLLQKVEIFKKETKTTKQIFLAMVTAAGLKPTMYSEELITNQVILTDLFKEG